MKAQPSKQRTKTTAAISKRARVTEQSMAATAVSHEQSMFDDLHARITVRAYYLYVERGRREGGAEQDWLDAEREILNGAFPV